MKQRTLMDPDFGALQWDIGLGAWSGQLATAKEASIYLNFRSMDVWEPISEEARKSFVHIRTNVEQIREFVAAYTAGANFEWGDRPDPTVSELVQSLVITHLSIDADGRCFVYFPAEQYFGYECDIVYSYEPDGNVEVGLWD